MALLNCAEYPHLLRQDPCPGRDFAGGGTRRDRLPDRRQRCRQDHHAEDHLRVAQASPGEHPLLGKTLTHLPPHEIVRRGIALVPEGRQVFSRMTTQENLEMGAFIPQGQAMPSTRMWKRCYRSSRA